MNSRITYSANCFSLLLAFVLLTLHIANAKPNDQASYILQRSAAGQDVIRGSGQH